MTVACVLTLLFYKFTLSDYRWTLRGKDEEEMRFKVTLLRNNEKKVTFIMVN